MYTILKKGFLFLLPTYIVKKIEPFIRSSMYLLFYKGDNLTCNICGSSLKKFIIQADKPNDLICPKCGSLPRTRTLWHYLNKQLNISEKKLKVLHFTPDQSLRSRLKDIKHINYIDSDYMTNNYSKKYDITNIPEDNQSFDLIICYHILEHVKADDKAIKELGRIIKPKGKILLQVPHTNNHTIEEPYHKNYGKNKRLKLYGQEDHVRLYGYKNFITRLETQGLKVTDLKYAASISDFKSFGMLKEDTIFIATINK